MHIIRNLARASLLAMMTLTITVGCAQEVGDIDRTQPNAIEKADLDPDTDWYYQRTVVDVPASDGFTFVGNTDYSGMKRIKWDIQENYLYARRQTELIDGANREDQVEDDFEGEVVAAYRILSHFDVQRQYNSATGEPSNVIVEDSADRPWYERDHMRVDWSTNLVTNYDLDFERASIEPVPYYIQDLDDDNPHAPVFDYGEPGAGGDDDLRIVGDEDDEDDLILEYFDITNKIHARAGTIFFPGFGEIPLCWLRGFEFTECGAGEYTIRNSFKRVDPEREYKPMPYKGQATDVFGFFTTDRMEYDNQEGIREQNKKRYLNRYNLWKTWYDEDGELLPHDQRELRPIVYHVNRDFPDDLIEVAHNVADQWSETFDAVVEAVGYDLEPGESAFILCPNNPVEEGDPEECGGVGNSPRLGDVRYSFMAYIPKFMDYGLLGLGPSNNDPETGEIISGMGYVYHWNDISAYRTAEMVELLNGTRDADDFIDGVDLTEWANQVTDSDRAAPRTFDIDREGGEHFVENIANRFDGQRIPITEQEVEMQREEGFDAFIEQRLKSFHRNQGSHLNGETSSPDGKLRNLQDTYIEDLMINDEILMATGHQPNTSVSDDNLEAASVLRGGLGRHAMELAQLREDFAEQRNMYLPEMADDALLGLARELADEDPDEVYDMIREAIYTAVLAHEVGHAVGLMHNFSGTEDAVNYFDEYWEIRDTGSGPVLPRIEQPITDEEIDSKIYHHGYSSVMDYAGRMTLDGLGLGKYDRAAIMYGYGGKVEVFENTGSIDPTIFRDWFEQRGDVLRFEQSGPSAVHYTTLYNEMGELLYDDDNRKLVSLDQLAVDSDGNRDWTRAVVDGEEYHRVPYLYCSHANYNLGDSCLTRSVGADSYERMKNMLDDLNTWYITRSFPRGRIGASPWGYISSYYPRIYNRLKRWHDLYGLYAELLPTVYSPEQVEDFFTDPVDGWGGKTWAVKNAFNYLVQTLLMPDVGSYEQRTLIDGTEMYTDPQFFINAELDVTQGRYYSTSWHDGDRECGYMWWECLHHIGFYLDKIMAIEALSDTQTNFVARSTPEDIREWEVGYFNTFGDQLLDVNQALMGQDYATVGPYLENDQVHFPDYSGELDETNTEIVDPYATFTIQLYWQVLGQARFPSGYDQTFMENSRIWIQGLGNAPEIEDEFLVTFRDPWSGYVYETTDAGGATSTGQSMLERANFLLAMSEHCDDDESTETPADDCIEDISDEDRAEATAELRDYMELIQAIAYITPRLSHGNPYAP